MILGFLIDCILTGETLLAELPLPLPLDPRLSSGVLVDVFDAVGLGGSSSSDGADTLGATDSFGATDIAFEIA